MRAMPSDLSVVVDDLNVLGPGIPDEADTPLIVDPDGMLPSPTPCEPFQTIPWWRAQILQPLGGVEHVELSYRDLGDASQAPRRVTFEQRSGRLVPETLDHSFNI